MRIQIQLLYLQEIQSLKKIKNQDAPQNTRDNPKEKDTIITDSLIQKGDQVHNTTIVVIKGIKLIKVNKNNIY